VVCWLVDTYFLCLDLALPLIVTLLRQIYAVPDLWCTVTLRSVDSAGVTIRRLLVCYNYPVYIILDQRCFSAPPIVGSFTAGGVFDPIVSSAKAVFEHVKDELAVILCLLLVSL